jgi:Fe/S biogenesis protein NfuA
MSETHMSQPPKVTITPAALAKFQEYLGAEGPDDHSIRMSAQRLSRAKLHHELLLSGPEDKEPNDFELVQDDVRIWIDPVSAELLDGATVDFITGDNTGFKFDNPNETPNWDDPTAAKIQALLDRDINPGIASHGGLIELLDYKDGKAFILMSGGCQGCGSASVTLSQGVEARLLSEIPELVEVVDTTDHAAGTNPFY